VTDTVSKEVRSRIMSRIRSRDTRPEKAVRSLLHRLGFRFRLHRRNLPGTPDVTLPKWRTCVFVQGCFWHQHSGCRDGAKPQSNRRFWQKKFARNVERDRAAQARLRELGWNVVVVWECEVRNPDALSCRLLAIRRPAALYAGVAAPADRLAAEPPAAYGAARNGPARRKKNLNQPTVPPAGRRPRRPASP